MPLYRCMATEKSIDRWSHSRLGLNHFSTKMEAHMGTIDSLRLFKSGHKVFCISGARDRQISLWDMNTAMNVRIIFFSFKNTIMYLQDDSTRNTWKSVTGLCAFSLQYIRFI